MLIKHLFTYVHDILSDHCVQYVGLATVLLKLVVTCTCIFVCLPILMWAWSAAQWWLALKFGAFGTNSVRNAYISTSPVLLTVAFSMAIEIIRFLHCKKDNKA